MSGYLTVLLLALMPAGGNFLGGVAAEFLRVSLTVAVEEIVVEAHEEEDARWASLFLVGGFALFALLTAHFE